MALLELYVAREVVIIGFTVVILTLSVLTIVFDVRQGPSLLRSPDEIGVAPRPVS